MVEDYFCSLSDVKLETDSDSNFTDKERTADSDIATVARSTALISLVITDNFTSRFWFCLSDISVSVCIDETKDLVCHNSYMSQPTVLPSSSKESKLKAYKNRVCVIFSLAHTDISRTTTLSSVCDILPAILALPSRQLTAVLRWLNKPKLGLSVN